MTVELSPLPCWQRLSERTYKDRVASLVQGIEERAAAERKRTGKPALGVKAILAQDPLPAPLFHAATRTMWQTLYDAYAWFVAAFRDASEKLRAGGRHAPRGGKGLSGGTIVVGFTSRRSAVRSGDNVRPSFKEAP